VALSPGRETPMEGDHESRLSKVERSVEHIDAGQRSLASLVGDFAELRIEVKTNGRDIDRLGEKVREQAADTRGEIKQTREDFEEALDDARKEFREALIERKSDRRYSLATLLTVASLVLLLVGTIFVALTFAGVGGG
jgi:hypothetical protein